MCMLNALAHQSSMQELDLLNPQLDPRISYAGGPKWYHGADGLLRESPGNYLLWSQDFSNLAWSKNEVTVVVNAGTAPDGTTTADRIVPSTTSSVSHRLYQDVTSPGAIAYTSTIYAKADGFNFLRLTHYTSSATVNLSDGSVVGTGGPPDAFSVTAAPLGYWRIEVNKTVVAGTLRTQLAVYATADQGAYAGDGVSGVLVWGAQIEKSSAATAYKPTTTAPAYDWPLEYDPVTLETLGRSGWEARTNLLTYSEALANASWTKVGCAAVDDQATGPDGLVSLSRLTAAAATGKAYATKAVTVAAGRHAGQLAALAGTHRYLWIGDRGDAAGIRSATIDLQTGLVLGSSNMDDVRVVQVSSGLCLVTYAYTRVNSGSASFHAAMGAAAHTLDYPTATWVGTETLYAGFCQLEPGALPGPYIPTEASQVTRPSELPMVEAIAEKLRFPGQSGTVVLDVRYSSSLDKYTFAQIDDGDSALDDDWLFYTNNNFDHFVCRLYPGGGHAGVHFVTPNTNLRMVEAADAAGAITSVNGDVPTIGANGCSQVGMQRVIMGRASSGSGAAGAYVRYMAFYPSKFTAAEVQARSA